MKKDSVAIAMWPTPWYLRVIGFPAWRVKERYWTGEVARGKERWKWGYYTNIHDYIGMHPK